MNVSNNNLKAFWNQNTILYSTQNTTIHVQKTTFLFMEHTALCTQHCYKQICPTYFPTGDILGIDFQGFCKWNILSNNVFPNIKGRRFILGA